MFLFNLKLESLETAPVDVPWISRGGLGVSRPDAHCVDPPKPAEERAAA